MSGRNIVVVEMIGDNLGSCVIEEHLKDCFNVFGFVGVRFKSITFLIGQLNSHISIRGDTVDVLALGCGAVSASDKTAVNGLVFTAAHKETELKVFLIIFVTRVISFGRCNNLGGRILKDLADIRLVCTVASRKTLQVND